MKVKDLIEKLQALDPELMVIVDGYEGGVNEAGYADVTTIALNVNEDWYYGRHEEIKDLEDEDVYKDYAKVQAVRIY